MIGNSIYKLNEKLGRGNLLFRKEMLLMVSTEIMSNISISFESMKVTFIVLT